MIGISTDQRKTGRLAKKSGTSSRHTVQGGTMKTIISTLSFALVSALPSAPAQADELNAKQLQGRQIFAQSCGVCHLQPSLGVKTYGPPLSKTSAAGNDAVMRVIIANGSDRMPAFKHYLKPAEIDAIVAYLRTVPAPVVRAANEAQK
jgi:mono/diheme cytochrome c family protein